LKPRCCDNGGQRTQWGWAVPKWEGNEGKKTGGSACHMEYSGGEVRHDAENGDGTLLKRGEGKPT